jgi:exosortase
VSEGVKRVPVESWHSYCTSVGVSTQHALSISVRRPPFVSPGIVLLALSFLLLYGTILRDLVLAWWNDTGASFGFAVVPVVLWLAWSSRAEVLSQPAMPDRRGLLLLFISCLLLAIGALASEFYLKRVSLVLSVAALIWTFGGTRRLRVLAFPICMLATVIPLPEVVYNRIALPLQLLASKTAVALIRLTDGTIYRDGNILHIPGLTLGVAEACSGLQSLSAVVVVAILMGFTHCKRAQTRTILLLAALPLAVIVNVLRVTGTVWLAQANQDLALGFYHSFSGWLIFVVTSLLVYQLAKGLHVVLDR